MRGPLVPVYALKFLIELVGWAGTGVFAFQLVRGGVLGWVLAIAVPLAVIGLWSLFVAPRAPKRLPIIPLVAIELAVFAVAAVGFWMLGWTAFAIVFAVVVVPVEVVLIATKSYDHRS
ncbi:hypothetical protein BH11ACT4_BH11ACT4_24790 [soil metagenome]